MYRAEFLNDTKNRKSGHVQNHSVMMTYTLNVQASSNEFEHATDRFYTLIYVFSVYSFLDVLFFVQFKNSAQFKLHALPLFFFLCALVVASVDRQIHRQNNHCQGLK